MTPTVALRILHERGRIASPWLLGMRGSLFGDELTASSPTQIDLWTRQRNREVVLENSPATVGCLSALVREALGDPHASVSWRRSTGSWVFRPDPTRYAEIESYVSEADAWKQALYAVAGVVDLGGRE